MVWGYLVFRRLVQAQHKSATVEAGVRHLLSVRPLGITTTPVKAWQVGLDTSNGSAAVGVQLGATAASGSNIPGQAIVSYYFDSTSASQSVTAQTFSTGVNMSGLKWSGTTAITTYQLRSAGNVNLEVTETAAGGGTLNLIAANDALSTAIPFALIYSTGSIGAFTSTTTLNGTYNLGGIVNGGVATKYVCVDASSNIVVQVAAC